MRAISQRIQGEIIQKEGDTYLHLLNPKPNGDAVNILFLRYAFVTMGREGHVFPSFLIDDWGAEVKGLKVYRWFREHANEFPRAEIFGFEADGTEAQRFLREFEHYVKLPCYAYTDRDQPVNEGVLIEKALLKDPNTQEKQVLKSPPKELVPMPLRRARLQWHVVPFS